jgi:hypothetical protein
MGADHRIKAYNRAELVSPETTSVRVSPLADVFHEIGVVKLIKIAASGAEVQCLETAAGLIAKGRPWVALDYGHPSYSVYRLAKQSLFNQAVLRCGM